MFTTENYDDYVEIISNKISAPTQIAIRIAEERGSVSRLDTIEKYREDQLALAAARIIPARVICRPVTYAGVPCEWVIQRLKQEEERIILYLHGGSWMFGNMETARPVGVLLSDVSNYRCLMVDYRLAPEHLYPAGLEDCYAVYNYLLEQGLSSKKIALFGDSAGGNLALALINRLKMEGKPMPACVGLASPVPDLQEDSFIIRSGDDLIYLQHEGQEQDIFSIYLGEEYGNLRGLPSISPITANLDGLPPVLIHSGGDEPVTVDNIAYAKKMYAAGGDVKIQIWDSMFHDFTIVGRTLKESIESLDIMGEFFKKHME